MTRLLAMNPSTCAYVQRENDEWLTRNSMRREATSAGLGVGDGDRERGRGHGDGLWVVGVDDVGPELFDHPRQPPRCRQVDLVVRRERDEVGAFGHAPEQLTFRMRHQRRPLASRAEAHHGVHHLVRASAPAPRGVDVQREHRSRLKAQCSRLDVGARASLQLPELGELQEHRVGVHDRNHEPDGPVEKSAAEHKVPEERRGRVYHERERSCALTALVHLPRGERRVVIDAIQLIAQIAKRVVLQLVDELTRAAVNGDRFVHVEPGPPRRPAVVQAGLVIRIEVGRPDPASEVECHARHPVAACELARWRAAPGFLRPAPGECARRRRARRSSRSRPGCERSSSDRRSRSRRGSRRVRPSIGQWPPCRQCFRSPRRRSRRPRRRCRWRRRCGPPRSG